MESSPGVPVGVIASAAPGNSTPPALFAAQAAAHYLVGHRRPGAKDPLHLVPCIVSTSAEAAACVQRFAASRVDAVVDVGPALSPDTISRLERARIPLFDPRLPVGQLGCSVCFEPSTSIGVDLGTAALAASHQWKSVELLTDADPDTAAMVAAFLRPALAKAGVAVEGAKDGKGGGHTTAGGSSTTVPATTTSVPATSTTSAATTGSTTTNALNSGRAPAKPDAVVYAGGPAGCQSALRSAQRRWPGLPIVLPGRCASAAPTSVLDGASSAVYAISPYVLFDGHDSEVTAFRKAMKQYGGGRPADATAAAAFATVVDLSEIVSSVASSTPVNSPAILAAARSHDSQRGFLTAGQTFVCDASVLGSSAPAVCSLTSFSAQYTGGGHWTPTGPLDISHLRPSLPRTMTGA